MEEWNYALCLIQVGSNFVSDIVIQLISDRLGISILGVASGRNYKISKDLLLHSVPQGFSVSSLRNCDIRGVTRALCILIHNIKEAGSLREGLSGKVISKMDVVVMIKEKCAVGCTGPTTDDTGMEDVRDISTYPTP